ncbi:hypothetical protein RFI_20961 [Reticulomyxa filosa]|uniref:Uncharacterized protein n=1 Tax=Reticulomyxa filosa TaxID=46433 RepID=X6MQZ4_RETFI|nr:hypothetical protein RFI_20961 [Reticulomyxa filosa]|eukprot:ETO16388.1 hypothetical protein RFI_20961 [Reticulomyxa filosa]
MSETAVVSEYNSAADENMDPNLVEPQKKQNNKTADENGNKAEPEKTKENKQSPYYDKDQNEVLDLQKEDIEEKIYLFLVQSNTAQVGFKEVRSHLEKSYNLPSKSLKNKKEFYQFFLKNFYSKKKKTTKKKKGN